MKNRIILCVFSCSLLLFGCTQHEDNLETDYTYVLFATPLQEHPVWLRAKDGFLDACKDVGFKCDWIGPTTIDITRMNEVVNTGILQKADAIITQGVVDPALLEKAHEEGIPVILVDSDMEDSNRTAYFGKDFEEQANLLLKDIEQKYGKETMLKIAIQVAEYSFEIAQEQIEEVKKVFSSHPGGFEIVAVSESKSDRIRAKREWASVFAMNQDVNVAISFAGESAESCYETASTLGIEEQLLIYGVDDVDITMNLIKEKKIDGSIIAPFYDYGYNTITYLNQYFKEKEKTENQIVPIKIQLITPENVYNYEKSK